MSSMISSGWRIGAIKSSGTVFTLLSVSTNQVKKVTKSRCKVTQPVNQEMAITVPPEPQIKKMHFAFLKLEKLEREKMPLLYSSYESSLLALELLRNYSFTDFVILYSFVSIFNQPFWTRFTNNVLPSGIMAPKGRSVSQKSLDRSVVPNRPASMDVTKAPQNPNFQHTTHKTIYCLTMTAINHKFFPPFKISWRL